MDELYGMYTYISVRLLRRNTYSSKFEDWKRRAHVKRFLPQIFALLELSPQNTSIAEITETEINDPYSDLVLSKI